MAGVHVGDFDSPDEVRSPDKTTMHVVRMGEGTTAARLTLQPGWRWSECIKPVVGTDSCQVEHLGYVVAGRIVIRLPDGREEAIRAGESYTIPPGHDAWNAGSQPAVVVEFQGAAHFAES